MSFVTVIGGANVDIGGFSAAAARMGESNPGAVRICPGGVGRNVAHNLSSLGVKTRLITVYGDDPHARLIRDACRRAGIDDAASAVFPRERTSSYLFLADSRGELIAAVNDMDICRRLTPAVLETRLADINKSAAVVLDTNLPGESVEYLARRCTVPLFADPVSLSKCERLLPVLDRLHTLKPNRAEAQRLSGVPIRDEESLAAAAQALLDKGVGRVLVSLGPEGVLLAEKKTFIRLPALPVDIVSVTGAGDAMMAAAVRAFLRRRSPRDTAREALSAACLTLETPETIHPGMSAAALEEILSRSAAAPADTVL